DLPPPSTSTARRWRSTRQPRRSATCSGPSGSWLEVSPVADLDKIRAVVERWTPTWWTPTAATASIGAAAGVGAVLLVGVMLRALDAGHALLVAGLLSGLAANALICWFWGRHKAADAREARRNAAAWRDKTYEYWAEIVRLREENARLADQVKDLTPGEVVARLHERIGDRP